jgi:predicted nucleotidyltransferase
VKLRVYNKTLDPNIWNEDKTIKPEVREALLKIAEDFYNSTDLKSDIQNILFLGSSANYNWTPTSDIDLHIVIDIAGEKINDEYARKFMDGLAFKFNTEHDIEVKGHPVELYLQDVREPNSTPQLARPGASIYSIYDDKWLLEPNPQKIQLDADKIRNKYQTLKKKIKVLVDTENIDQLKTLMKSIRNYRNAGLAAGGEFSVENLVFKALRHTGDLTKIKDTINTVYDRKASLPEEGNRPSYKNTQPLKEFINESVDLTNFLIVGLVSPSLDVVSEKDWKGGENVTHEKLIQKSDELRSVKLEDLVFWRYKLSNNTLYWLYEATDDQKKAVVDHLHDRYNINNPQQRSHPSSYHPDAYNVDEAIIPKNADLYLGFIKRENFKVIGTDVHDDSMTHGQWQATLPKNLQWYSGSEALHWRYKRNTNTVYWWSTFPEPNEEEKQSVEDWLFKHANIKYPKHQMISWAKDPQSVNQRQIAHTADNSDDYKFGIEEGVKEDPQLYIGMIDDDNYRVVTTPVTRDNVRMEHAVLARIKGVSFQSMKFRYRKDLNTVFWQYSDRPTQIHKDVVDEWIMNAFNLPNPKHHTGPKNPQQINQSHGTDLFFRDDSI